MGIFSNFFKRRSLESLESLVAEVNEFESQVQSLSDDDLKARSAALKEKIKEGATLDAFIPEAFALVREAAQRTLRQRPFDVQMLGGVVLHQGAVAEMATGEGKTLSAVAPVYLNALEGKGAHVVTVNEYLARRDAAWMGQIYYALGLSVACLVPNAAFIYDSEWKVAKEDAEAIDEKRDALGNFLVQQDFLRPVDRKEAYRADVTYGTNHEFGFDYLRDNLAYAADQQVQRGHHFAIIDEVDSILIDEARTPLIIAAPDTQASDFYKSFARVVTKLEPETDYIVDEKRKSVSINDAGIEKVERLVGIKELYSPENLRLVHYLEESLRAKALFLKDRNYVVKNGEVIIVDEFTGRMLMGRRYSGGLHQAIEAKEGVLVKEESKTYAKISIQNYFRLYKKISGMTGTAQTSAEEFHKVYNLEVVSVPTNRPLARKDYPDGIYKNAHAKWNAVVGEVKQAYEKGQPVLLGTTSIEKNELISGLLRQAHIPHEVLNAKNNEREGAIIAQAGRLKAITVATNVAGRGVDIILGGNPPTPEEAEKIRELGGLHVVGTERHEARRIDNQLRGRAGRQGDPGTSRFFLSLEDDLMRIFGGDQIRSLMDRFNLPEDQPIEMGMVSRAVAQAQSRVEGSNFDVRKHLLEYDDVLNKQRDAVYRRRQEILGSATPDELAEIVFESVRHHYELVREQVEAKESEEVDDESSGTSALAAQLKKIFEEAAIATSTHPFSEDATEEKIEELLRERLKEVCADLQSLNRVLSILDLLWMNHLEDLDALSESIGLRAYAQKDPLVEYRRESHNLFQNFWGNFDGWIFTNLFKLSMQPGATQAQPVQPKLVINAPESGGGVSHSSDKIGRNDPCPCGAINPATGHVYKYKKCGLINAPYHRRS